MAQKGVELDTESFSCSVCLDLLKEPVTLPCGHSYCLECIQSCWGPEDEGDVHSCPQCRQTFPARLVLGKNTMLADVVEQLKKSRLQAGPADHCYAGAEDVACDVCTGRKLPASKSCLVCVASFCEQHLQRHHDVAPLKKHQLVEPSNRLQENMCSGHQEVRKMFCRTDQQCICFLCSVDLHKGHDIVSAAAARRERQGELEESRHIIQQRIQDAEKDVKLLEQQLKNLDVSADQTVEDCEKIFSQLIRLLQQRSRDVEQQVRSRQRTEASGVRELQEKLQQEMAELKRKDQQLEQLEHTEDHNHFLLSFPSLSALSQSTHSSSVQTAPLRYFEDVTAAVAEVPEKLQDVLRETWTNVSLRVAEVELLLPQQETRAAFLKYSRELTLDPNTVNTRLLLSEGNRKVSLMKNNQPYSQHPDRFTECHQVLSRESLTGRCYWEVEVRGGFGVAVAYKNISRGGDESFFGDNDKSWSLRCYKNSYSFHHNRVKTPVSGPPSSRLGVYLDHTAGILSFFSVSETTTLLHRVQTTFTQPLLAGVRIDSLPGGSAELMKVKQTEVTSGQ